MLVSFHSLHKQKKNEFDGVDDDEISNNVKLRESNQISTDTKELMIVKFEKSNEKTGKQTFK